MKTVAPGTLVPSAIRRYRIEQRHDETCLTAVDAVHICEFFETFHVLSREERSKNPSSTFGIAQSIS